MKLIWRTRWMIYDHILKDLMYNVGKQCKYPSVANRKENKAALSCYAELIAVSLLVRGLSFCRVTSRWWGSNHTSQYSRERAEGPSGQLCLSKHLGTLAASSWESLMSAGEPVRRNKAEHPLWGHSRFPHNLHKQFLLCLWNWMQPSGCGIESHQSFLFYVSQNCVAVDQNHLHDHLIYQVTNQCRGLYLGGMWAEAYWHTVLMSKGCWQTVHLMTSSPQTRSELLPYISEPCFYHSQRQNIRPVQGLSPASEPLNMLCMTQLVCMTQHNCK